MFIVKVEPGYSEGPRDWPNLFAITSFRYIKVLFHVFYYYWDEKNRSSYRGLYYMSPPYIDVRYIEVPLFFHSKQCLQSITGRGWDWTLALVMIQFQISQKPQSNKTDCMLWNQAWDRIIITCRSFPMYVYSRPCSFLSLSFFLFLFWV